MEATVMKNKKLIALYLTALVAFSSEVYAAYYYSFFKGYSYNFEDNFNETVGISVFLLTPYIFVLLRARAKNSVVFGIGVNILLALIAASVFYNSLIRSYHISTASYSFVLVPFYQAFVIFIFFLGTRKNA